MIRRSYIDNEDGGQIHIAEIGQGKPVLLLHQTPRSWDEFREVMGFLASDLHLIAMDLPGMGASSCKSSRPSIELYANAAIQVIESKGLSSIDVCGHHTGGVVGIELASKRPELVSSLLLSSTPWVDAAARMARSKKIPIDSFTSSREGDHLTDLWRQRSSYYPEKTVFMDRFLMDAMRANRASDGHWAVGQYEMEKSIQNIMCPVLLVEHMGDPFAVKHTEHLRTAIPHAHVECIPDGKVALEATASKFSEILKNWMLPKGRYSKREKLRVVK